MRERMGKLMINQSTLDTLRAMRMSAMAQELEKQLADPAYKQLPFEDRLAMMVDAEWNKRQNNKLDRLIRSEIGRAHV